MKVIKASSELHQLELTELSHIYAELVEKAREAYKNSYSPYSNFPVGAAVLLVNGEVITGSNQENAAYPSGLCAERTALFYAGSKFPNQPVKAIAVAVAKPIEEFPFPCGSCLQVLSEFQEKQTELIDVLMAHPTKNEVLISKGLHNLLPFAFKKDHLGK